MREIKIVKCPCKYPDCGTRHLVGIGRFDQGSGFSQEEAERIVAALKLYDEVQAAIKLRSEEGGPPGVPVLQIFQDGSYV